MRRRDHFQSCKTSCGRSWWSYAEQSGNRDGGESEPGSEQPSSPIPSASQSNCMGTSAVFGLSVEGKVFFSIVSQKLTEFLLKNNYIDPSVQKRGIPGAPGCLEHTCVVTQLIREAHENRGDLVVLWLDLANAYGSIPHKLVKLALHLHHVPSKIKDLILDYYNNFRMRVTSGSETSDRHRIGKGITTGCYSLLCYSFRSCHEHGGQVSQSGM